MAEHNDRGNTFELDVERLLRLQGYTVRRNEIIRGTQVDLVAWKPDRYNNVKLVVECTDRDERVGVDLVKQKAALLFGLQDDNYFFRVVIVTRNGFTADAKTFASGQRNILLRTIRDLEQELVDFQPYVDWYVHNYESSAGIFHEARLHERYVELSGRAANGTLIPSLTNHLKNLVRGDDRLIVMLGDFGAGKTSFCRQLTFVLVKEYGRSPQDETRPVLPLLINLREYRSGAANLQQVITNALVNRYGVTLTSFAAFERLVSLGNILLVMDGFDEMAEKSDRHAILEAFTQIHLMSALNARVLLTCRSNFFQSHADILGLLRQFEIEIPSDGAPATKVTLGQAGHLVYVEKLSPTQIREFVSRREGRNAKAILDRLARIHDLTDLSSRPVLLDMIITTLPQLKDESRVNSAELYQQYTDRWTSRDGWRFSIPLEIRQQFCDELAWTMQAEGLTQIPHVTLEAAMLEALSDVANNEESLKSFMNDIQTCSFLVRDASTDTFRFAHKSFREFFVARRLIDSLLSGVDVDLTIFREGRGEWEQAYYTLAFDTNTKFGSCYNTLTSQLTDSYLRLGNELATKWRGKSGSVALRTHVREAIAKVIPTKFSRLDADLHELDVAVDVAPEIATFAIEYVQNRKIDAALFLSEAAASPSKPIFVAILRRAHMVDFVTTNGAALRNFVLSDGDALLRAAVAGALTQAVSMVDDWFVQAARPALGKEGWSYFLFALARSGAGGRSILARCSKLPDLDLIDRLICLQAIASPLDLGEALPDAASAAAMFSNLEVSDQHIAVKLLAVAPVSATFKATAAAGLLTSTTSPTVRVEAELMLAASTLDDVAEALGAPPALRKTRKKNPGGKSSRESARVTIRSDEPVRDSKITEISDSLWPVKRRNRFKTFTQFLDL